MAMTGTRNASAITLTKGPRLSASNAFVGLGSLSQISVSVSLFALSSTSSTPTKRQTENSNTKSIVSPASPPPPPLPLPLPLPLPRPAPVNLLKSESTIQQLLGDMIIISSWAHLLFGKWIMNVVALRGAHLRGYGLRAWNLEIWFRV